ncbi:MAG: hybrid sensor histidine kinase/response regulator [bacterium]|nr:hybrid sensor histidine kinase/response regulator [bacterium]
MTDPKHLGKVLMVDDVFENIDMMLRVLNREGYEVIIARDGEEAMVQVAEHDPDIILLDVMMPGIDGFQVCQRLKQNDATKDIPVIFITALANTVYIVKGFEVGAVDFITKPFRPKEVVARVNTHLTVTRQRKEIERLREQDRVYFEKLTAMKDDVMNMASHDLKNPLNNVKTAVSLIRRQRKEDDEKGEELLRIIENSAEQMKNLITGLLDLAKIETGRAINLQPVKVNKFLDDNLSIFKLAAHDKNITLEFTPIDEEAVVPMDLERMEQVLQNLLSNAIKYTPAGGKVMLGAVITPDSIIINVQDTGMGIPADDLPHLFEKFYRVKNSAHMQVEGTGLGLSIVKSIVENHDGTITVESEFNKGTTFSIHLPY